MPMNLRYTNIIDSKVSQVSMNVVIGLCSKCIYHFVANLLTKRLHKSFGKSAHPYGRYGKKYFGVFFYESQCSLRYSYVY